MSSSKPTMWAAPLLMLLLVIVALRQDTDRNHQALRQTHRVATPVAQLGNMNRLNAPSSIQTGGPAAIDTAHQPISSVGPTLDPSTPTPTTAYPSPMPWPQPTPDATSVAQSKAGQDISKVVRESTGVLLAQGFGPAPTHSVNEPSPTYRRYPVVDDSSSYTIEEVTLSPALQVESSLFRFVNELHSYECPERICVISKFWRIRLRGIDILGMTAMPHSYPVYIDETLVGDIGSHNWENIILLDPSLLKEGARIGVGPEIYMGGFQAAGEISYLEPIHFVRAPTP